MMGNRGYRRIGRRAFLGRGGALVLAATAAGEARARATDEPAGDAVRFGMVTDLHYADKEPAGTRHYRETPAKLAEAVARFRDADLAFVVELGDLIDAADSVETEARWLETIDAEFTRASRERHYVLGNHCVDTLTKDEFLGAVGQGRSYYSFDRGGLHFVVLDACFREDGRPYGRKNAHWTDANIPAEEVEWLRADLAAGEEKTIVFAHQRLDVEGSYAVNNAEEIRRVLEGSGRVAAVFQGHSHRNDYREVGGIHYATLVGMIEGSGAENNGYAVVSARPDGSLVVTGFRTQASHRWA
ncbi:metallophosphoesterase family protein [Paludisphaera sp.]|uniref:metallophosphoesterase family protein n=1 Tax=Paludisphaera sp. TaxID=2017432 RepID=UPI00301E021B